MRRTLLLALAIGATVPALTWSQVGNIVVTNAASFQIGLPSLGSIGTIFCTGLDLQGTVVAPGFPLPMILSGVAVTIDDAAAPLLAVADRGSYQQINFQVPIDASTVATVRVVINQNSTQGSVMAPTSLSSPGEFFRAGNPQFGVFQHTSDYSLVTPDNPGVPGEILVGYATGLPPTVPRVPLGQPAPLSPLSYVPQLAYGVIGNTEDETGLSINGTLFFDSSLMGDTTGELPIPFIGLTPGAAGLYQINFALPVGTPSGNVPIQIVREFCAGPVPGCAGPKEPQLYKSQPVLVPVR